MQQQHVKKATLEALVFLDNMAWEKMENREDAKKLATMIAVMKSEGMLWPVDKLSRWFGFVQGVLFSAGLLDIVEEADRTRPIFQGAYKAAEMESM